MNISVPGTESSDMTPLAATETGGLRGTWTISEIGGPEGGRLRGRSNKQNRSRDAFPLLISFKEIKILSFPATEKIRTVQQTFIRGLNLVVINHSYSILNFF